jgi:membrane protease YdiL (CAAX protease family)
MEETGLNNRWRHPLISILITLAFFFVGFQIIGPAIGAFIALPFFPGTETELMAALADPTSNPAMRLPLFIMQSVGVLVGMILLPWWLLRKQKRTIADLFHTPHFRPAVIVPVLVVVFMGVNSIVIKWNADLTLPFGMDEWARPMEEKLTEMTKYLINYESAGQMIFAFIVVAVLPAIGEELVFRGIIQNEFYRATRNPHVAVWVAAFIFSAVHFQFYGFFPRMLLGALFGYLYIWSGNLWMPVLAHFVNNGFTLVSMFFVQNGTIPVDLDSVELSASQVLFSAGFTALLIYSYRSFYNTQPKADIPA